jgi:arylsulfatase A-like enzyme
VIFYVIDGAGADFMSVYGYNRRTTPNLERIAPQGAIFERAYSNAAWTKPSTASFMTSLQHSVLGGFRNPRDPIPDQVVTMAQHLHRAGYQTAVFTSNPHAGSLSDLQRGVDVFRDKGAENHSTSSVELHEDFWKWREEYPGEPFWVHFQTTDVHELQRPVAPFAGLYVAPPSRSSFFAWWRRVWDFDRGWFQDHQTVSGFYRERLEEIGVDPVAFFDAQRGLYDETMAHQDYQLGRLVERLKATGEWENTLLIVASDHGHPAGSFSRFGRELIDPPPPEWEGALFDSHRTHIPMIIVWPGHIAPGQRFRERVSMIDMLPTVLDLAGLPMPEVLQGQSLAPLLLGEEGWEQRPVIFEQLQNDSETGEFTGHIEVMDGRWGASLEIYPERAPGEAEVRPAGWWRAARPHRPEVPRLLLYDLWNDPYTLHSVNEEHPDLVEKYTKFLEAQWEAHLVLAQRFTPSEDSVLTPEQLETLRSLGYIGGD